MILLNPGPVTLSDGVRAALAGPDLCHREPEFGALQGRIREGLTSVYGLSATRWAPVLISGSGTAAVEAMITSLVPPGSTLVTIENGVYGERLSRIARACSIPVTPVQLPWGAPVDRGAVQEMLDRASAPAAVAMVHHETTTGRLNDPGAIGRLCRERGARLLLDAVSSFGGEAIGFDAWPVDACAATANKCLHGAPGVSFVLARRELLTDATAPRSVYLDLAGHLHAQDAGSTAFTPAVPAFHALDAALGELAGQGGWQARHARYAEICERVRSALAACGIVPHLPPDESSVVLRSYHLPPGMSYEALHDALKARGFVIYAGQGQLARELFRISPMGEIGDADIERLVSAFREILS